jgi:hypothetical protein
MKPVPTDAWTVEPDTVSEGLFTKGADDWTAWNEWSVEVEVADFLPSLIDTLQVEKVIETGCGQGYVTRRIDGHADVTTFETDQVLREKLQALDLWHDRLTLDDAATPTVEQVAEADLMIVDSDTQVRINEVRLWAKHGKPDSYLWIHDTAPHHQTLRYPIFELLGQYPHLEFSNPRGSTLFYKPETIEGYTPPIKEGPSGSIFVVQIDGGTVDGAYAHSMVRAIAYTMQHPGLLAGYLRWAGGPLIAKARTEVVRHFLDKSDADWLIQIDSDMVFDPDYLVKLWQSGHQSESPIVAGHCYALTAERGPTPTMWTTTNDPESPVPLVPFEGYPFDRLVPVEATGAAFLMVHRSVFEKLRQVLPDHPYPWFEEAYWGREPVGEDLTFCLRARKAGFPIFVDTRLDVGHSKTVTVNRDWYRSWRKSRRFVITGFGRSGTGYIADALRRTGVICGHEWVYKPEGPDWKDRWGDASWMAAPHLEHFDGPTIHLTRNPYKVAESLIGVKLFDRGHANQRFREYAYKHVPGLDQIDDPIEATVTFMDAWSTLLDTYTEFTIQLETLTAAQLADLVNLTGRPRHATPEEVQVVLDQMPKDVNHRPHTVSVDWDTQPKQIRDVLDKLCVRYGYGKE